MTHLLFRSVVLIRSIYSGHFFGSGMEWDYLLSFQVCPLFVSTLDLMAWSGMTYLLFKSVVIFRSIYSSHFTRSGTEWDDWPSLHVSPLFRSTLDPEAVCFLMAVYRQSGR
jgi:hypothetical protein